MDRELSVLRKKGYKITPQRRAVLEALHKNKKFPTALQLLEEVKKTQPDVSLDTIYRNLALLSDLGLVHEVHRHNGNIYEILVPGEHHHHIVCTQCGETQCLDLCPVREEYQEEAEKKGFRITGHVFEFYGLCEHCRKKKEVE